MTRPRFTLNSFSGKFLDTGAGVAVTIRRWEKVFTEDVNSFRNPAQVLLGAFLTFAGITHLTTNRAEFQAQVPTLLQGQADLVVLVSGVVEISEIATREI
jgi:hypothetical protein